MPGPGMAIPAIPAIPVILHATCHMTCHAGGHVIRAAPSFALASIIIRQIWRRIPPWIREDKVFKSWIKSKEDDLAEDPDELASVNAIVMKLQAMVQSGSVRLNVSEKWQDLHASVLAYIQLSWQIHERSPESRDWICRNCLVESDQTLPRRSICNSGTLREMEEIREALDFSNWAYEENFSILQEELEERDYFLLQHHVATKPGYVGHFVAISPERRTMVIGVKGTSTLEDILTDCCGNSVAFDFEGNPFDDDVTLPDHVSVDSDESIEVSAPKPFQVRCHEGILISTKRLAKEIYPLVQHVAVNCQYDVLICGHSLGAGAASLLSLFLRARFPVLKRPQRIKVIAIASPPVLDHDASIAASTFITTVVNNSDIIPRSSMANLAVLVEFLKMVHEKLKERGMGVDDTASTMKLFKKLSEGTAGDMLMSISETERAMKTANYIVELRHPKHLYVPGRVLFMYENWEKDEEDGMVHTRNTFGTATVLRFFELDGFRFLTDHLSSSYEKSIDALLLQRGKKLDESL